MSFTANQPLPRRRALKIIAAAVGTALTTSAERPATAVEPCIWRGVVLGAAASITLYHANPAYARKILAQIGAEIRRLEKEFSLYRPNSALCRLNRQGYLDRPSFDMLRLLGEARVISEVSDGAFDVSVQPLWKFYQDPDANSGGQAMLSRLVRSIDYRAIRIEPHRITLEKPGMELTLNGIAQGYITDRVADRLRNAGFADLLLNLGEVRATGLHPDGRVWRIGVSNPSDRTQLLEHLALTDCAVSTSSGLALKFNKLGNNHHLFDPRTGQSCNYYDSITVVAPTAMQADALSTAFFQLSDTEISSIQSKLPAVRAILRKPSGVKCFIDASGSECQ